MAKKKNEPQRILRVNLFEGEPIDLEIGKAIELHTSQSAIYIEKMKDGKYRLAYDVSVIPDFRNVQNIEVVRIDAD